LLNIPLLLEVSRRFDSHFVSSIFSKVFDNSSLIYLVVKINDDGDFKNKKIVVAKDLL